MVQDTDAMNGDGSPIDQQYSPVYVFDENAGSASSVGETVDQVPREDQIEALKSIEGDGPVEPDGWFGGRSYGVALPVVNGVPLTVLERSKVINNKSVGVESSQELAVDSSLGVVELHRAGGHPTNTSKIKVNESESEGQDDG